MPNDRRKMPKSGFGGGVHLADNNLNAKKHLPLRGEDAFRKFCNTILSRFLLTYYDNLIRLPHFQ